MIIVIMIAGALIGFSLGYRYVRNQDKRLESLRQQFDEHGSAPFTKDTPNAVEVYVRQQFDTEDIANMLKDKGLIDSTLAFKILSKFNGFDGHYRYGTHYLLPDMSYDEIMVVLTNEPDPVKITIVEGMTYNQMKKKMLDAGMRFNPDLLDAMVRRPYLFTDYSFVPQIEAKPGREWLLQGYLWPDTYQFDINATEQQILRMILNNTERHLRLGDYYERAAKLNMTLDEVMTLASIVQVEGNIAEMPKIAKVFRNRIDRNMPLQSCATINYLRTEDGLKPVLWVLNDDLNKYHGNAYNTYSHDGLPPGPINSPGTIAIEAVLWPATAKVWKGADDYLYFVATGEGTSDFSMTYEEHAEKAARYSQLN